MRRPARKGFYEGRPDRYRTLFRWRRCDSCGMEFRRENGTVRAVDVNWAGHSLAYRCEECSKNA